MDDILVREAEKRDIEAMAEVIADSWNMAYKTLISEEDMKLFTNPVRRAELLKERFDRNDPVYVLLFLRAIKGVCSAQKYENAGFHNTAEIDQLYFSPSAIGRGFGGILLEHMLNILKGKGFKQVVLFVMEGNERAIGFYSRFGFKPDGFCLICESLSRKNRALRYIKEL